MKKLLTLTLLLIAVNGYSQIRGFLKPVPNDLFELDITTDRDITSDYTPSKWLVRPIVTLSAMQFMFTNPVTVKSFSSVGTGVSYSHFTLANGEPYQNFAANFILLFTNATESIEPVKLSVAGTVSLWQYINFGAGYSFENKKFFLMTGISYNFN